jgi:hypothetical protein
MNRLQLTTQSIFATLLVTTSYYHASFALPSSHSRVWGSAEYINWWVQDSRISAPLITQNNNVLAKGFINSHQINLSYVTISHKTDLYPKKVARKNCDPIIIN